MVSKATKGTECKWEIRAINPQSIFGTNWCTGPACLRTATYYLVRLPDPTAFPVERESRMRRCEMHARENARTLQIPFPESGNGAPATTSGEGSRADDP